MRKPSYLFAAALLCAPLLALDRAADEAVGRLRGFLERLKHHEIDLYLPVENGVPIVADDSTVLDGTMRFYETDAIDELTGLLHDVGASGHPDAPLLLVQAAVFRPERDPVLERKRWRAEQPWLVRRLAADALVAVPDDGLDAWLSRLTLKDRAIRDGAVKRELAARVLARRGAVSSASAIGLLVDDESPAVRAAAVRSLGELGVPSLADRVLSAEKDADPAVRLECMLAIDSLARVDIVGALRNRALKAGRTALEDSHWTVRLAAAQMLGAIRDRESIPPLIRALEREQEDVPGSRHRVRSALRDALGAITGEDFASFRPADWNEWWEMSDATFEMPVKPKVIAREQGARFAGIPIEANSVVFLLDVSGSMHQPSANDRSGPDRWTIAVREFDRCVQSLPKGTRFNVVLFNESFTSFAKGQVALDDESSAAASAFVRATKPEGGTDLIGAFEVAFGSDRSRADGASGLDIDTLVVLTDGVPSRGAVLVPEQILYEIENANRSRRIAIHCIDAGGVMTPFLDAIATANHGEHAGL